MTEILHRVAMCAYGAGLALIALAILYYIVTALAYGIARSVLQAKKDHSANKENNHERQHGTQTPTH